MGPLAIMAGLLGPNPKSGGTIQDMTNVLNPARVPIQFYQAFVELKT